MKVKNWSDFQHYKHRCPPWIKLHHDLLDNYEFHCLPVASMALAPMLWLLASESKDGSFAGDVEKISFRLHLTHSELISAIKPLIAKGFFVWEQGDSELLAVREQSAETETETETYKQETETKLNLSASPGDDSKSPKTKPKSNGHDSRHAKFQQLIFKCYSYLNNGENCPWDGSDAKQLALLIKAKPDLDDEKFHQWLGNYAASENINPADRPRVFLRKITSYAAAPLTKFGRPNV